MRLKTVFIRFYKSFNFDYLRKNHPDAKPYAWEYLEDGRWYPYVRIPIEDKVTAIVGANESGKSQLLSAIEKGANIRDFDRSKDFCRYSEFYSIEKDKLKYPSIGFEWVDLSDDENEFIRSVFHEEAEEELTLSEDEIEIYDDVNSINFKEFKIFFNNNGEFVIYINSGDEKIKKILSDDEIKEYKKIIPRIFRIDSKIALPESIPIQSLINDNDIADGDGDGPEIQELDRKSRSGIFQDIFKFLDNKNKGDIDDIKAKMQSEYQVNRKEIELVKSLIFDVANIDRSALQDLSEALKEGDKEGVVNGITQTITDNLRKSLNFPRWWEQDRNFNLKVDARDYDLVFTIVDRTQTNYSFDERSSGLKYFLSYYIQYRAYKPEVEGDTEILLMDEPDAYLSSQAQQDLLKILEAFADPVDTTDPVQVVYVTHSPFLINKNHGERIRVLDKGAGDEGTRVVKDVSKNHYEPLRSAFGAFVGETTFIGNCNLFVEGLADQILLAGASKHLRKLEYVSNLEILDLNHITIVPAGSASHIPYLVYLARGRDIEQPPIIVLLDSDGSGNAAIKIMTRGGDSAKNKPLDKKFILQIGDLKDESKLSPAGDNLLEIEDLIPLAIYADAIKFYLSDFCDATEKELETINDESIQVSINSKKKMFENLNDYVKSSSSNKYHLEKVGLARSVISVVESLYKNSDGKDYPEGLEIFERNFKILFKKLIKMQQAAEFTFSKSKVYERIIRVKNRFLQDKENQSKIKKEDVVKMLNEMEGSLDESLESSYIILEINMMRNRYELDIDLHEYINDTDGFILDIDKVVYAGKRESQVFDVEDLNQS